MINNDYLLTRLAALKREETLDEAAQARLAKIVGPSRRELGRRLRQALPRLSDAADYNPMAFQRPELDKTRS